MAQMILFLFLYLSVLSFFVVIAASPVLRGYVTLYVC
jgi:hypothetical protein